MAEYALIIGGIAIVVIAGHPDPWPGHPRTCSSRRAARSTPSRPRSSSSIDPSGVGPRHPAPAGPRFRLRQRHCGVVDARRPRVPRASGAVPWARLDSNTSGRSLVVGTAPGSHEVSAEGQLPSRSTPWSDECGEDPDGQQELQVRREAPGAVPAETVVEELSAADTQEGEDVLEVGGGARRGAERRWGRAGLAARRGEERLRRRWRSRSDASGSPGAGGGRPRGGQSALGGAPQVATCSPHRRRRP